MKQPRVPKTSTFYKSAGFAVTDSSSGSDEERPVANGGNQAANPSQSTQRPGFINKNKQESQGSPKASPPHKIPTNMVETSDAISKKRTLSPYAPTSGAKRLGTQGGFVLSSDEDDESIDGKANDHSVILPKAAKQRNTNASYTPVSTQIPRPAEPTKGLLPTKQLNKARLNALLGKNRKSKQATKQTLLRSEVSQPLHQFMGSATDHNLSESSESSEGNRTNYGRGEKVKSPQNLGTSLLGVKKTTASSQQSATPKPRDNIHMTEAKKQSFSPKTCMVSSGSSANLSTSYAPLHSRSLHTTASEVTPRNTRHLQPKSIPENNAAIKSTDTAKEKEHHSAAGPHIGIEKEMNQREYPPAFKSAVTQPPTKARSESMIVIPPRSAKSLGVNTGRKEHDSAKSNPDTLQSQHKLDENGSRSKQRVPEVQDKCSSSSQPLSYLSNQVSEERRAGRDHNKAGSNTAVARNTPETSLPSNAISTKIDQESLNKRDATGESFETASISALCKPWPRSAGEVIPDAVARASPEILMLSQNPEVSKQAQPYFEYSVFQKDWSSQEGEDQASTQELTVHPFTNVHEANSQAERLSQSRQEHPSYMLAETSTKRDEHGCITLTSSIAPADYPANRHYTKIYVRRDHVSKFANQTPQSLKRTRFISDTGYILRLFKLVEISDADGCDDSDSSSNSSKAAASRLVRAYHPHNRPEVYTTLEAANRAARNLQIELSHEKNPKDATTKAFQEQDLKKLNAKVLELESASYGETRCWQSKFNASGIGGDNLELVVEKVGICGPRNI